MARFTSCPTFHLSDRRLSLDRVMWACTTVSVLIKPGPLLRFPSILVSVRSIIVESPVPLLSVYPWAQREAQFVGGVRDLFQR